MKTRQSTSKTIQIAALVFAAVACIAAIMVLPEFWQFFRKDQGAQPAKATLFDYFPIFIGSSWTYNVSNLSEVEDPEMDPFGTYTDTIVTVETGPGDKFQVVGIKTDGENPLRFCEKQPGSPAISPDAYYAINKEQLYVVCTLDEAYKVANEVLAAPETIIPASGQTPDYVFPFEVGNTWQWDDSSDKWYVESIVDVTTPAGHFTDCYRIVLFTLPDTSIRWVCPGVGLVAAEYHHHGSMREIRAELASYQIGMGNGP